MLDRNERWAGTTVIQFFPWQIAPLELHTDHWTPENRDALFPDIEITQTDMPFSTHWYKDAEYIQVKIINISYELGAKLLNNHKLMDVLIFIYSLENLGTLLTNYHDFKYGWDRALGFNIFAYSIPLTHFYALSIQF